MTTEEKVTEYSQAMMKAALGIGPQTGKRSWEYILEPIDEEKQEKESCQSQKLKE